MSRPEISFRVMGFVVHNLRIRIMTFRSVFATGLAFSLSAFFVFGAYGNFLLSPQNAASYARWSYPDWFHYITATLELAAAALLINPPTRKTGAAIGALVMGAASLTTLFHTEYDHAISPLIVLIVSLLVLFLSGRTRTTN
ncbi:MULTISPECIES: DoxX family protein [unclassified Ochrobactrum]|jgi:hypothetical protein|uniref:DoxX family protein n=1 Tax=unclassified Ochrobactrum TaxID=239106 RepID=UPI003098011D